MKALASFIVVAIGLVIGYLFLRFTYFGENLREVESLSPEELYLKLAEDFDFWNKVINSDDPNDLNNMTWSQHRDTSIEEKIRLIKTEKIGKINAYIANQSRIPGL
jgi:hypothetical protein